MINQSGNILIVDDDTAIRHVLRTTLGNFGFSTEEASNGEEALAAVRAGVFDAILLDVNMPGMGGMDACRALRQLSPELHILMLTARDNQDDLVRALEFGADDYVTKPFHIRELTARLRVAVRRSRSNNENGVSISIGQIELDPARRTVRKNGALIHLTPKEFDLLHYLMSHADLPVPHAKLLQNVWGPEYGNELEYLRTFIRQLRLKIEDNPAQPTYLKTDPYIGYRFQKPA